MRILVFPWPWSVLRRVALACLLASPAFAGDSSPVTPLDASKLLGKDIAEERQEAIIKASKSIRTGDWEIGFGDGPEGGLYRDASTYPLNGDKQTYFGFSHGYKDRCEGEDRRRVALDMDLPSNRFPVKGKPGSQQAIGWVSFAFAEKPATPPKRTTFGMDELLGLLHQVYDLDRLKALSALVICPTSKAWDGVSKDCVRVSLKGFAQAFDYVCDAKPPAS
jgi:hypothetical protein